MMSLILTRCCGLWTLLVATNAFSGPLRPSRASTLRRDIEQPNQRDSPYLCAFEMPTLLPWAQSIEPSQTLTYMHFFEWQMDFMKRTLTNLRELPVESRTGADLGFVQSDDRRMHTVVYTSDEYKTIRLTSIDAGSKMQVFTSVWTPQPTLNLPILGTDLLQFNDKKHVCIVGFQPIQETEEEHDQLYEHLLQPIRDGVPSLQGDMTNRFYDADQFFSKQMLIGRSDSPQIVKDVFPAYTEYVRTHVQLAQSTQHRPDRVDAILERHRAYDRYSAERDPAHGLLANSFGADFADAFVHDVLFPLSR